MLSVKNISVFADVKEIVKNISFEIKRGEIALLTGKNGAGKSTVCNAIMGLSGYKISTGSVKFNDVDLLKMTPDERAKQGIFLSYQTPVEIQGLSVSAFLKYAINNLKASRVQPQLTAPEFFKLVYPALDYVGLDKSFLSRDLNHNFSGGEKKKSELLQMILFEPKFIMLDEIDAGADTNTREKILETIRDLNGKGTSFLIITHNRDFISTLKIHNEIKL